MTVLGDEHRTRVITILNEETFLALQGGRRARTAWQREADHRWPDGWDMVEPAYGDGRWATVAWCGQLSVELHATRADAERALARIKRGGCGHACWGDHELVDLAAPEQIDPRTEWLRGPHRAAHAEQCATCRDWAGGRLPAAAMARASARRKGAAA